MVLSNTRITKALSGLRGCAGWSAPLLFANLKRQVFLGRGLNVVIPVKKKFMDARQRQLTKARKSNSALLTVTINKQSELQV